MLETVIEYLEEEMEIIRGSIEEYASEEDKKLLESFEMVVEFLKDCRG